MKFYNTCATTIICILICFTSYFLQAQDTVITPTIKSSTTTNSEKKIPEKTVSEKKLISKPTPYKMGDYLNNRVSIKIGVGYSWRFNLEVNYTFLNIVELGLHTGIGRFFSEADSSSMNNSQGNHRYSPGTIYSPFALILGANLNIHILPLFGSLKNQNFDFYICNKFYSAYGFLPKHFFASTKSYFLPFHAETGLGFAYNFPKKWGLYIEGTYQYQNYKAETMTTFDKGKMVEGLGLFHARIGFTFKLNK